MPHIFPQLISIRIHHNICIALENRSDVQSKFFDLSQAFDMVWYAGISHKMINIGMKDTLYYWFQDYNALHRQIEWIYACIINIWYRSSSWGEKSTCDGEEDFQNNEIWTGCNDPKWTDVKYLQWEAVLGTPDRVNIPCLIKSGI